MSEFPPSSRPPIELTDTVKSQIRELLKGGVPHENIAEVYNCSEGQVRGIWSHMVRKASSERRKPRPVTEPDPRPTQAFRRSTARQIVRIDASNFDEVILVNGDSEINVQISS